MNVRSKPGRESTLYVFIFETLFKSLDGKPSTNTKMIQNIASYREEMAAARDIFESEPASGSEKLIYYINLLFKYGSLKFLKNDLIKEQSFIEIHNLDVLGVLLLGAILIIGINVKCVLMILNRKSSGGEEKKKQ